MEYIKQNRDNLAEHYVHFNDDYTIIVDIDGHDKLLNFKNKKKWLYDGNGEYPYYTNTNKKTVDIIQFLYGIKTDNVILKFKDNNKNNLTQNNIEIYHEYDAIIKQQYNIKKYIQGHYKDNGQSAYLIKNPVWITNDGTYLMYCEGKENENNNVPIVKLCKKSYDIIKKYEKDNKFILTFYKNTEGYIIQHHKNRYMHQIIMNFYGNGKGTTNMSVDHINNDKLNNTYDNLRIATQKEQRKNTICDKEEKKKQRPKTAMALPYVNISNDSDSDDDSDSDNDSNNNSNNDSNNKKVLPLRQHTTYNKTEAGVSYYRIEKSHPDLTKCWNSNKRKGSSLGEKLKEVYEQLDYLKIHHKLKPRKKIPMPPSLGITMKTRKSGNVFYSLKFDKRIIVDGKRKALTLEHELDPPPEDKDRESYNPEYIYEKIKIMKPELIGLYPHLDDYINSGIKKSTKELLQLFPDLKI
jgi:hypothetical protein